VSKLIERISEMFGKNEEPDSTEEVLLDFLSKKARHGRASQRG